MSQHTKLVLNNKKEEVGIKWDMQNGELKLSRSKLPDIEKGSGAEDNHFTIRIVDLDPEDWVEFAQMIYYGFEKLFEIEGYSDDLDEEIEFDVQSLLDQEEDEEDD